ncbi:alpha/beta hydrolase family protein [Alkaliphilus peptidifermentans]|uniref:Alpha/beta hydrolase family protein n=1 Tax=Alkaliphilus peptidifermentans DSM 18978 TaxID=1120976 RepID=A0A1G5IBD2_9FIRM|nr:alpha/beta hydrolase family protein [Alkaliphilus peptidifermentans]SCY72970.1 Alpha/beta hydrolase family protein [Alkaliphilus peptidifermentans DSM 18978]
MNRLLSNTIENLGVNFFKYINRKKENTAKFHNCRGFDANKIKSMYSRLNVFSKCEYYSSPKFIELKEKSNLEISIYSMKSKYKPIDEFEKTYESLPTNNNIYFERVSSKNINKFKTCIIYLHGFSERSYDKEIKYLFSPLIAENPNIEILAVHLPYHMRRSPEHQPYSGAYIFDSYPIVTIEGFRQGVHDVSQVISYAKENYEKVIVAGFSLGGHIISFLGTCDNRADLYCMGQAGARMPETLKYLTVCPGLNEKKQKWIQNGIDFEELYRPIELLDYDSIIPPEKVISIGGKYDKLIRFRRVQELRNFFKSKHNISYDAGHIGLLFEVDKVKEEFISILNSEEMKG